ncbi:MAG: galactokinase [Chloroflexi bacterium]|nr:MAG: galactokinase [Chloroflexota bacterium]
MTTRQHVIQQFSQQFDTHPPIIVRSPGRVNLIGEHTDYNDGFVLPMAINRATWIALRPREDDRVIVHSLDFEETLAFSLSDIRHEDAGWGEYLKGVAWALQEAGHSLRGWEGVLAGDVPIGAGLSSSAALELATARAFAAVSGFAWDATTMAKLGQRVENRWIGVQTGIMDQMIVANGHEGYAVLIDCRSLETKLAPLPAHTAAVILDTATRRGLVDSAYNERRAQCEAAAQYFGVAALRDVSPAQLEAASTELDALIYRRARHVVSENQRTLDALDAMHAGDAQRLGQLMNASHESLRDDYEVSSEALNTMVDVARAESVCYGARMTGAGFGGCAVALVEAASAGEFAERVSKRYQAATGLAPNIYVSTATNGAEIVAQQSGS